MRTLTRAQVSHEPPVGVDGFVFVSREDMMMAERIWVSHSIINGAFARAPISWYDINAIASTTPNPAVITPGKAYGIRRDPMFRK